MRTKVNVEAIPQRKQKMMACQEPASYDEFSEKVQIPRQHRVVIPNAMNTTSVWKNAETIDSRIVDETVTMKNRARFAGYRLGRVGCQMIKSAVTAYANIEAEMTAKTRSKFSSSVIHWRTLLTSEVIDTVAEIRNGRFSFGGASKRRNSL